MYFLHCPVFKNTINKHIVSEKGSASYFRKHLPLSTLRQVSTITRLLEHYEFYYLSLHYQSFRLVASRLIHFSLFAVSTVSFLYFEHCGDRGSTVVKVLCYKSEGHWFDPSWCHWNFSLTQNPSDRTMVLGSTQHLIEMSTRSISWG